MTHKLCPACGKHSIIFTNWVWWDGGTECNYDYYCRTCKRIIKPEEFSWHPKNPDYKKEDFDK